MKDKYFSEEEFEEGVYNLQHFKDRIKDGECDSMVIYGMERDIGGPVWCRELQEFLDEDKDNRECGKDCNCMAYNPCNGVSGRCRYLVNGFIDSGRQYLLTKDGKAKEVK